jgi:hypothetical protein
MIITGVTTRGLEVSLCGLGEGHLVQGQIGNGASQPGVLRLKLIHSFDLVDLEAAEHLTSSIIGDLRRPDQTHRVGNALTLRQQNINLAQLRDDFLRRRSLARHFGPRLHVLRPSHLHKNQGGTAAPLCSDGRGGAHQRCHCQEVWKPTSRLLKAR